MVAEILPVGMPNKISGAELVRRAGCRDVRELQKHIESERLAGAVICSTAENGGGYFLPDNIAELRQHVNTVDARARNTLKSNTADRKALRKMEKPTENR